MKKMTKGELLRNLELLPDSTEIYVDASYWKIGHDKSRVAKDFVVETTKSVTTVYLVVYQ